VAGDEPVIVATAHAEPSRVSAPRLSVVLVDEDGEAVTEPDWAALSPLAWAEPAVPVASGASGAGGVEAGRDHARLTLALAAIPAGHQLWVCLSAGSRSPRARDARPGGTCP